VVRGSFERVLRHSLQGSDPPPTCHAVLVTSTELDVLPAVEAFEGLAAVCAGTVGPWADPTALVGVQRIRYGRDMSRVKGDNGCAGGSIQ